MNRLAIRSLLVIGISALVVALGAHESRAVTFEIFDVGEPISFGPRCVATSVESVRCEVFFGGLLGSHSGAVAITEGPGGPLSDVAIYTQTERPAERVTGIVVEFYSDCEDPGCLPFPTLTAEQYAHAVPEMSTMDLTPLWVDAGGSPTGGPSLTTVVVHMDVEAAGVPGPLSIAMVAAGLLPLGWRLKRRRG